MSTEEEKKPLIAVFAVDDEHFNLELIARTLEDYQVETFEDPRKALHAARRIRPAVVLVDFRMPHLSGVDLVRQLQSEGLDFVSLLVTAYADLEAVVRAKRDNLTFSIVVKPWKPDELRNQVELAVKFHKLHRARNNMNESIAGDSGERPPPRQRGRC
jgi:two-component system OmpR family response regulator